MTELRINGFSTVYSILYDLSPYIKFKEIQTKIMMEACQLLKHGIRTISKENILKLVDIVLEIQKNNYKSSQRKTKEGILKIINLTP